MTNVQVDNALTEHPAYGPVMVALAEVFTDLGDQVPALRCIEVADRVYGINNRDVAVLCRIMGKLCEADPTVATQYYFLDLAISERRRLEDRYQKWDCLPGCAKRR